MFRLAGIAGFEPAREGVKVPCLTAWLYSYISIVRYRTIDILPNLIVNCKNYFKVSLYSLTNLSALDAKTSNSFQFSKRPPAAFG